MFHSFRWGCENICSMTKDTNIIRKDPKTGLRYVTKVIEEMTNNHRECGKENIASIMPQTPGMCNRFSCNTIWKIFSYVYIEIFHINFNVESFFPLRFTTLPCQSFELQVSKLHLEFDRLWQRQLVSFMDSMQFSIPKYQLVQKRWSRLCQI